MAPSPLWLLADAAMNARTDYQSAITTPASSVAPAPALASTPPDGFNSSAARDSGLPAVEPAAAPMIAVDHAPGKPYFLEANGIFHDILTHETPSFTFLFTPNSYTYQGS